MEYTTENIRHRYKSNNARTKYDARNEETGFFGIRLLFFLSSPSSLAYCAPHFHPSVHAKANDGNDTLYLRYVVFEFSYDNVRFGRAKCIIVSIRERDGNLHVDAGFVGQVPAK